jgi:hypothetical protein
LKTLSFTSTTLCLMQALFKQWLLDQGTRLTKYQTNLELKGAPTHSPPNHF